jgi:excisionase family DNA binding protein
VTRLNHRTSHDAEPFPASPYSHDGAHSDALAPPAVAADPEVYSTQDVARIFGRTERTVRNWVRAGRLRRAGFGRSVFFSRAAIDALLGGEPGPLSPGQYGSSL